MTAAPLRFCSSRVCPQTASVPAGAADLPLSSSRCICWFRRLGTAGRVAKIQADPGPSRLSSPSRSSKPRLRNLIGGLICTHSSWEINNKQVGPRFPDDVIPDSVESRHAETSEPFSSRTESHSATHKFAKIF